MTTTVAAKNVTMETRYITPDIAKEMLKFNGYNRPIVEGQVIQLSKQMKNGEWLFDGQPLRFGKDGRLLDGQHRLSAIIMSETTQEMVIMRGIDSSAFKVMDTGKLRSTSDIFQIEGIKNHSQAASISKLVYLHSNKLYFGIGRGQTPTNQQLVEFYLKQDGLDNYVSQSKALYNQFSKTLNPTTIGALFYLTAQKDVKQAEIFWSKLCTGLSLEGGSPMHYLREFLIENRMSQKKYPRAIIHYAIYYCWNAFRRGEKVTKIDLTKFRDFPELI